MITAWIKKCALDWPMPLYVLFLAAFPVLFLYTYNIEEMSDGGQILLPLALCLAGALLLWILLTLILHDGRKAGLAVLIFLVFFFSYGRVYQQLEFWKVAVPGHQYLVPAVLLVWGYCVYFISLLKRDFRTTTTALNVIACVLVVINLANIAIYQVNSPRLTASEPVKVTVASDNQSSIVKKLPDIYFIILDEYAHIDTLKEWYDYNNSAFYKSLQDKGFYIVDNSHTRSPWTPQAIAQVLNMEYFTAGWDWNPTTHKLVERKGYGNDSEVVTVLNKNSAWNKENYGKLSQSKVVDFLRSKGYKWVYFGTPHAWDPNMKANADIYINYFESSASPGVSEFQHILWNTTMIKPYYTYFSSMQYDNYYRKGALGQLEGLKKLPEMPGPKFVFVHFIPPHQFFVFGPKGEVVAPANYENYADKQYFLGQCIFMATEIDKVLDEILAKSKTPPIIVLQSDHGIRPHHPNIVIGGDEWRKILNAMYLPGLNESELSDNMCSVNTFRFIFNHYFDADYPLFNDD